MRGRVTPLAIIVAGPDQARLESALRLAAAQAALGGAVTVFLDSPAVALLASESEVGALLDTCHALGGTVMLCQTGLAEAGLRADALDPRFTYGGMVGFLAASENARLVLA
ncbi:peroxiredoxin [Sphingomonas sp.]|uniref:peroxiredoxin n=1 Tax=Sphingomonas sp. TaxID=28214 RepID=UPI003B3AD6E2